ncbi:MAG: tetratricopeptide repeat protein [Phycisphaerae bacterium]|nr:tetratricopeptide repeat protein [Phycisphaerae bacterium]
MDESKDEAFSQWRDTRVTRLMGLAEDSYASGQLASARKRLVDILGVDPENQAASLLLGRICLELNDPQNALKCLEDLRMQSGETAEICYLLGMANEKLGNYSVAFEEFHRSFELNPRSLDPVEAAAESLVAMGKTTEAQKYLEGHMKNIQGDPGTFELAGRIAMILKDYSRAAWYFQKASDFDVDNQRYPEMLAHAEFMAGRPTKAVAVLKNMMANKDYKPSTWVYTTLGDCYIVMNQPENAIRTYHSAAKLSPENSELWVNIAKASLMQKDFKSAIRNAEKALVLDPVNSNATVVLGYSLVRDKQFSKAIEILESACQRNTKDVTLRCLLGQVYEAQGDKNRARKQYAIAFRSDPTNSVARELLTRANSAK